MDSSELRSLQEATYIAMNGHGRSYPGNVRDAEPFIAASIFPEDINLIVENAMARCFYSGGHDLHEVETKETREGTKYKVRVKDRQTNSSYVRFATREKIAELRANPNISSVELTDEHASGGTADGATGRTQTFGAAPNQNRSGSGYKRPQPVIRPSMEKRMSDRDNQKMSM
tara:strand:+ start:1029 stop:1544 length:516 start_codon:yes stop_codon:yes gene_type:complete